MSTEDQGPQGPDVEAAKASTPPENEEPPADRYGVYDNQRLRFIGGVYGSRKDARKAAKAMGVPTAEIRPL